MFYFILTPILAKIQNNSQHFLNNTSILNTYQNAYYTEELNMQRALANR